MGWDQPDGMTHRQFEAWQQWLDDTYSQPDRSDFYSMQIAAEIRAFMGMFARGGGKKVELADFVLRFGGKRNRPRRQDAEEVKGILAAHGMRVPGYKANEKARARPGGKVPGRGR